MGRKRRKPEEIVAKLRQVDVWTVQGRPVVEAIRLIGVVINFKRVERIWRRCSTSMSCATIMRLSPIRPREHRKRIMTNCHPRSHRSLIRSW